MPVGLTSIAFAVAAEYGGALLLVPVAGASEVVDGVTGPAV